MIRNNHPTFIRVVVSRSHSVRADELRKCNTHAQDVSSPKTKLTLVHSLADFIPQDDRGRISSPAVTIKPTLFVYLDRRERTRTYQVNSIAFIRSTCKWQKNSTSSHHSSRIELIYTNKKCINCVIVIFIRIVDNHGKKSRTNK